MNAQLLAEIEALVDPDIPARAGTDQSCHLSLELRAAVHLARRLARVFRLPPPDAPGLCFLGAELDPAALPIPGQSHALISVSGKGRDLTQAVLSCVGEAVEYASQLEWGNEKILIGTPDDLDTGLTPTTLEQLGALRGLPSDRAPCSRWISGVRLGAQGREEVLLPAELCLRGIRSSSLATNTEPTEKESLTKLSTGCAAAPTLGSAILHGLLELIERDALALWWLGGHHPRILPWEVLQASGAAALHAELRQGSTSRATWLLDIMTDLDVPVVAALSCDEGGRGLVGGFAAGLTYAEAMHSALLELCQMEVGLHIIALKRQQQGDSALNAVDRRHLKRALSLDASSCRALVPAAGPSPHMLASLTLAGSGPPAGHARGDSKALESLVRHLKGHAIETFAVDLTRPQLGIAVARTLAPGLQQMPSPLVTERLSRQIHQTGGGFGLHNRVEWI